jgi:RNA polymerase sigma factor (sigma-70 family)
MSQRDRLLDHIRRIALEGMGERQTDGQLLEYFISKRDEAAFALLLRRHGAMVWSVCRRILGNSHDADDAYQASCLVLVRKAESVRPRESVGNWLYGVAYRTALEARGRIARRRAKEQSLQDVPPPESKPEEPWQELWPILDRELSRLADKYRLPIVLCDLEGRSRKEVARQLAIPEGTLSSRLAAARKKLAARLARYGFTVSGMSLAALLTENTATATVAPSLFATTTKAALLIAASPAAASMVSATVATLTEGVLKTMFIAKIKTAALVVCSVAALGAGTGGVYYQTRAKASDSPQLERVAQDDRKKTAEPGGREIDKLRRENEQLKSELDKLQSNEQLLRFKLIETENVLKNMQSLEGAFSREKLRLMQEGRPALNQAPDRKQNPNLSLEKLESDQGQFLANYKKRWNALQAQLSDLEYQQKELRLRQEKLEAEQRVKLAEFGELRDKIMREQAANQAPNPGAGPMRGGVDKLDQILQRLDRLEKRLDRLEKGRH